MKKLILSVTALLVGITSFSQVHLSEGFESGIPSSWSVFTGTNGLGTVNNWTTSSVANTGSKAAFINYESVNGIASDWLVTPQVTLTGGLNEMRFQMKQGYTRAYGSVYTLRVSTTSQTNIASFTTIQTWTEADFSTNYEQVVVDLAAYNGQSVYFAFVMENQSGDAWYIDDLKIFNVTCPNPSGLAVVNSTNTSIDLGWTPGGSETSWMVYYNTGLNDTAVLVNSNPATITGLTLGESYDFSIRAICTAGDSSEIVEMATGIACGSVSAPHIEPFNTFLPTCWQEAVGSPTSLVYGSGAWIADGLGNVGTTGAARVNLYGNTEDWLISPIIDLGNGTVDYSVSADIALTPYTGTASASFGAEDTVYLIVSDDNGATWDLANSIVKWHAGNTVNPIDDFSISLTSLGYTGTVKMAFYASRPSTSLTPDINFYVDNFEIDVTPTCFEPDTVNMLLVGDTALIDWNTPAPATTWEVQYGPFGFTPGTGISMITTNDFDTIFGVSGKTDFYVRGICGAGDSSKWSRVSTIIPCGESDDLCADMENYIDASGVAPDCWSSFVNSTSTFAYSGVDNLQAYQGTNSYKFYNSSDATPSLLLSSPRLPNINAGTHRIKFYAKQSGGGDVVIGTITDPTNDATFTPIDTLNLTLTYEVYKYNFDTYLGSDEHIAFRFLAGGTYDYAYLDNICWEMIPSCPELISFADSNITQNSVDLRFVSEGVETMWEVKYDTTGFNIDSSGMSAIASSNPYTLTGLMSATNYDIYVRPICGAGDTGIFVGPITISTDCGIYTEACAQFDDVASANQSMPICWSTIYSSTSTFATVGAFNSATNAVSGNQSLRFYNSSDLNPKLYAISPRFSNLAAGTHRVTFSAKRSGSADLVIGTIGDPMYDTTFTPIDTLGVTTTHTEYIYNFDTYAGTDAYIAVRFISTGTYAYVYLDNFCWEPIPTCPKPTAISLASAFGDSVSISWTPGLSETMWEVQYDSTGFTFGTGTSMIVSSNPTTITGLTPNGTYDVYVRAICGAADTSIWSSVYTFNTGCAIYTPTYNEDFSTYVPNCWSEGKGDLKALTTITGTTSNWIADGFGNNGTTGAARMEIWSTTSNEWLFTPSINLGDGSTPYQMEFDLALTYWSSTAADVLSNDDTLAVVISTDNGATWSVANALRVWDATNSISNTGEYIRIDLSAYTGIVKFGFYAQSNVSGGDVNVYIDNFSINPSPSCPKASLTTAPNGTNPVNVDLSIIPGGSETSWEIEYGTTGFAQGTGTTVTTSTTPYAVIGLLPLTGYDFYVRAICGAGDSSEWNGPKSYTTPCGAYTPTYLQDFSTMTSSINPNCWSEAKGRLVDTTITTGTTSNWTSDGFGNNGTTGAARMEIWSTGKFDWLISPTLDLSGGAYQLEFDVALTTWNTTSTDILRNDDTVAVVVSTDNGATWLRSNVLMLWDSAINSVNPISATGDHIILDLSAYTGNIKVGFYAQSNKSGGDVNIYIDNFLVREMLPCPFVSDLATSSVTTSTVGLSWTNGGAETSWEVEYVEAGMPQGSGTATVVSTNPYTVTGLNNSTAYSFYVRAICGAADTSHWVGPVTTSTLCGPFGDFCTEFTTDGTGDVPYCWDTLVISTSTSAKASVISGSNAYSAPNCLNMTNSADTNAEVILITPYLTDLSSSNRQLRFQAKKGSGDKCNILVGTMSDVNNSTTFVVFDTVVLTSSYVEQFVDFVSYTGADNHIAFKLLSDGNTTYENIYIDNLCWEPSTTCKTPRDLTFVSKTETSILVAWNDNVDGTDNSWVVSHGPVGYTPGQGTSSISSTNSFNITGLTSSTEYDVYIKGICSVGDSSNWVGPLTVRTKCGLTVTLPYTETFDSETPDNTAYTNCGTVPELDIAACWTGTSNEHWSVRSTATSTTSTGPSTDASGSGNFIYAEASSCSDYVIELQTPKLDLTGAVKPVIEFSYHMYGALMGDLDVFISSNNGSTWVQLASIRGNKGDVWNDTIIPIYSYANNTVLVKFEAYIGGITSDIALDNFKVYSSSSVGIDENTFTTNDDNFKLFPNPNNGQFNIINEGRTQHVVVSIVDVQGKVVLSDEFDFNKGANKQFNFEQVNSGVYFVRLVSHDAIIVKRIVVEK